MIGETSAAVEFRQVFESYAKRILAREPMVMYRFGDGEMMLVNGEAVDERTQAFRTDRWSAPGGKITRLGRDLKTALETQEKWAHFGIPCPCCNAPGHARLAAEIKNGNVFPANIFINGNYSAFKEFLSDDLNRAAVITNTDATGHLPFQVLSRITVPDDCVNYYEICRDVLLRDARDFCRELEHQVVLVAAGPLSEALLFTMWQANPNNTYVDVGSALDEYTYGRKTRPYMFEGDVYATKSCPLPRESTEPKFAVTVPPYPGIRGRDIFFDVMETTRLALQALGCSCMETASANNLGRQTIFFGTALIGEKPPAGSIIYNMEQPGDVVRAKVTSLLPELLTYAIWEYSAANLDFWREFGVEAIHVPIGHIPGMEFGINPVQDVDVLFHGWVNPRRQRVLDELTAKGLNVVAFSNKYGAERNSWAARSKVVLNMHFHEPTGSKPNMFEIVRVSPALGSGVCVVSETSAEAEAFVGGVAFTAYENLASLCESYVRDAAARKALAAAGQEIMRSFDARVILGKALGL